MLRPNMERDEGKEEGRERQKSGMSAPGGQGIHSADPICVDRAPEHTGWTSAASTCATCFLTTWYVVFTQGGEPAI